MADWREGLLPCSWRGVPCLYKDFETPGGRRSFVWELIDNDEPYGQDLGRRAYQYRCELYVVGADFMAQRDRLVAAMEAKGIGQFSHPYEGMLTLRVSTFRLRHLDLKGRSAWFDVLFLEGGSATPPQPKNDTAAAATASAASAKNAQGALFAGQFQYSGQPEPVTANADVQLAAMSVGLAFLANAPNIDPTQVNLDLAALAAADPTDALGLATLVTQTVSDYVAALVPVLPSPEVPDQTASGVTVSSRGAWPVADPSYGLVALASWSGPAVPSGASAQTATNAQSLATLVQGAAVAGLAILYAQTEFASSDDASAAGAQLSGLLDQTIASAAAAPGTGIDTAARQTGEDADTAIAAWRDLSQASATDFVTRAAPLPNLVQFRTARPRPSVVIANRLYPDRLYEGNDTPQPIDALAYQLVARNRAIHPLFMPTAGEGLAPGSPS